MITSKYSPMTMKEPYHQVNSDLSVLIISSNIWIQNQKPYTWPLESSPETIRQIKLIHVSNVFLTFLESCTNLEKLSIKRSDFTDDHIDVLVKVCKKARNLSKISLANNDLTDEGARNLFSHMENLSKINLSGNYISEHVKKKLMREAATRGVKLKI